jgi:Na+/melibiose symporter-like transporter
MRRDGARRQVRFDVIGALLVAVASFCLVFGLSQGPTYGWWKPLTTLTVNGHEVWARGRSISIIPFMLVVAIVVAFTFLRVERWKEARDGESLFPLSQLEHRGFRNGIVTALMFTLGAFGFMFVLPVFLQQGKHLDAMHAGLWLVAYGLTVLVGAQIAGSLAPRIGPVVVVRLGICVSIAGTLAMVFTLSSSVTFLQLLPCMVLCGIGAGFVNTQLSNVILFDVDREHAGVAAASASTVRQLGAAFGIAVIGTVLSTASRNSALSAVRHAPLAADARARLLDEIRRKGMTITGDRSVPTALLPRLEEAVAHGARVAFLLAVVALVAAQLPAWRIPRRAGHVDALLEGAADERPEIIPTVPAEVS